MPDIEGLSAEGKSSLSEWWRQVREVLLRMDQDLRLVAQQEPGDQPQATHQPQANEISEEAVITIVDGRIGDIIANARYTHRQGFPSLEWKITHNLGWRPSCTVIDSTGNVVWGDVFHSSDNHLTVRFSSSFSGTAYLT